MIAAFYKHGIRMDSYAILNSDFTAPISTEYTYIRADSRVKVSRHKSLKDRPHMPISPSF